MRVCVKKMAKESESHYKWYLIVPILSGIIGILFANSYMSPIIIFNNHISNIKELLIEHGKYVDGVYTIDLCCENILALKDYDNQDFSNPFIITHDEKTRELKDAADLYFLFKAIGSYSDASTFMEWENQFGTWTATITKRTTIKFITYDSRKYPNSSKHFLK